MKNLSSVFLLALIVALAMTLAPTAMAQTEQTDDGAAEVVRSPCPTDACPAMPPTLITGTLGSCGNWPDCTTGLQTGRLNRNGIGSECDVPKACAIFATDPGRAYDAYVVHNGSGTTACVTSELTVITQTGCNLQLNTYLDTYDPANICTGYLGDPGLSSGVPPTVTTSCSDVPDGSDLILVVHTTNIGEIGCDYEVRLYGSCIPVELQGLSVE
jgi:hypothetical protein